MEEVEKLILEEISKSLKKTTNADNIRFYLAHNEKLAKMFDDLCKSLYWDAYYLGYEKAKAEKNKLNWEEWNQK